MLVYVTYFLLLINFLNYSKSKNFKDSILSATLIFSGFIVFITETLSLCMSLNLNSVAFVWTLFAIILVFILLRNRKRSIKSLLEIKVIAIDFIKSQKILGKIILIITISAICLLFYQGLIYPTNNWDSLTYHMTRIMHWLGNESVAHFPSTVLRNLYQPPFAEYFIMHINLLNGNDYFSNSVQLFFLTLSIVGLWSILDYFDVSRFHKIVLAFSLLAIPAVELQSTTTKNDIVCGFFIIVVLYFCIKTYYETYFKNFIFLGLSIGLAIFTKGTAYIFLPPILVVFVAFLLYKIIKVKNVKIIINGFIAVLIALIINFSHFSRNYAINQNILVIDNYEGKGFSNVNKSFTQFKSNLLKNIGLQLGYPFDANYDSWIKKFHRNNNIDINSPHANWSDLKYEGANKALQTHEDYAPNTYQLFLMILGTLIILSLGISNFKKYKKELLIVFVFITQIILFVFILKWQPWHTRLHIPIFMISTLVTAIVVNKCKWFSIFVLICIPLQIFTFSFTFLYNNTRPIITDIEFTKDISIKDHGYKKYFANRIEVYPEYALIQQHLYKNKPKKIGLEITDFTNWEYPFFRNYYYDKINIVCINVKNITAKIPQDVENIDCIISTNQNLKILEFAGKKYINQTPTNVFIWYYK